MGQLLAPYRTVCDSKTRWTPKEAIVDAGSSEVPLQWAEGITALPPLSNVSVCKHKVEKPGEGRGDPSRFNVITASYSDRR